MQTGLQSIRTGRFLGVNLRQDRLSLADEELAKAINADLHSQLGAIVLRLGRTKQNSTALTDTVIRRLAKINSKRYQVAGTAVYRDETSILTGLSSNLFTTIIPFRPLNDSTLYAFIADDALMRKDDGTTVTTWGIVAPTTRPTFGVGDGGQLSGGIYTTKYTYVRKSGTSIAHESNPSPVSNEITPSNQELVAVPTLSSDSQVTAIRWYRTVAGGSSHLFEVEVDLTSIEFGYAHSWEADEVSGAGELQFTQTTDESGTTGCFQWELDQINATIPVSTDSAIVYTNPLASSGIAILDKTDAGLGSAVETNNNPPPTCSWAEEFQNHVFLCRDSANAHYLWWSRRFLPESFPTSNFLEIGNPDDALQCAVGISGLLGAFTRRTKYRVVGNATSGFTAAEAISRRGTPAPLAVVPTEFGIIFPARDGIYITNLINQDRPLSDAIFRLFIGETVNDMAAINWSSASNMAAAVYKNRYYWSYPSGTNTNPDVMAVYSEDTKKWYFYDHPMRSLFVEEDVDDLVGGSTDGFIYILEDGTDDAGGNIALDVETKDFSGGNDQQRKLFRYIRPDMDTGGATVNIGMYVDGSLKRTATYSGSRTKPLIPFPEASMGYQWRANITYTGTTTIRVYGIEAIYLPLGEA